MMFVGSQSFGGAMFDANDWIDRFKKAGGRMEIDGQSMRPLGQVSAECNAIWNEIKSPADPDESKWKAVHAEVLGKVGGVGQGWSPYPDRD
jgi:hypothetical protein